MMPIKMRNETSTESTCIVCLEAIDAPLQCGHYVHQSCVARAGQNTCSVCRAPVTWSDSVVEQLYNATRVANRMSAENENLNAARQMANGQMANNEGNVAEFADMFHQVIHLLGGMGDNNGINIRRVRDDDNIPHHRPRRNYELPTLGAAIRYTALEETNDTSEMTLRVNSLMHLVEQGSTNEPIETSQGALDIYNILLHINRVKAMTGLSSTDIMNIIDICQ